MPSKCERLSFALVSALRAYASLDVHCLGCHAEPGQTDEVDHFAAEGLRLIEVYLEAAAGA